MLANAVAIKADVKYANRISGMDGVKSVNISEYYYAPKDSAVTNDANVWGTGIYKVDEEIAAEYNGKGMVVAVLDTGLDASHKAFLTNPSDKEALLTKDDVGARVRRRQIGRAGEKFFGYRERRLLQRKSSLRLRLRR